MAYLGQATSPRKVTAERYSIIAASGQTTITGLEYTIGQIDVFRNGIKQVDGVDFNADDGVSVVFTNPLVVDDDIEILALRSFQAAAHPTYGEMNAAVDVKANTSDLTTGLAAKLDAADYPFTDPDIVYTSHTDLVTYYNYTVSKPSSTQITVSFAGAGSSLTDTFDSTFTQGETYSFSAFSDWYFSTPEDFVVDSVYADVITFSNPDTTLIDNIYNMMMGIVNFGMSWQFNTSYYPAAISLDKKLVLAGNLEVGGVVTMPGQPAFNVSDTSSGTNVSFNGEAGGRWDHVRVNTGNHFNVATGRFTAPVAGVYVIGYMFFTTSSGTTASRSGIGKNGVNFFSVGETVDRASGTHSVAVNLEAGDYISLQTQSSSYNAYYHASGQHNVFWGYLIG